MNVPDFNFHTTDPHNQQTSANTSGETCASHPIESASASTTCQTSSSRFAYILTGGVLGVIALISIAIALFAFAVLRAGINSYDYTEAYEDALDYPETYDELLDYLDRLDEKGEDWGYDGNAYPHEYPHNTSLTGFDGATRI